MNPYDIFFSICLGLFIGGIILSIISILLAEMSTQDGGTDHFDHIDHIDHVDHLDHIDHVDYLDHIDHVDHLDHIDHVDHLDHIDKYDHIDNQDHIAHVEELNDSTFLDDTTPAPFMLLLSTSLLFFGVLGILFSYIFAEEIKFIIFFLTPGITYMITKFISVIWRKIAKSRYYTISSTKNLIGTEGEVVLEVDEKGGIIKIPSYTPLKFEKIHVKSLKPGSIFEKGEFVYICDIKNSFFLVDKSDNLIKKRS
ncbi:MAG: NfeD family protein [Candidatus Hermodarchaeota archaeon]